MSEAPLQKTIYAKMKEFVSKDKDALSTSHQKHLEMVYEGKYVYFSDLSSFQMEMTKRCDLALIRDKFTSVYYTIGLQNNSAYYDIFSQG